MPIVELPNSILHKKSLPVTLPLSDGDKVIAEEMINYIKASNEPGSQLRSGIGIAAVQLGYLKQMFYVKIKIDEENQFEELLINPKILKTAGKAALEGGEGCLSVGETVGNQTGLVHRALKITVIGYSYFKNDWIQYELEGLLAIVFQHEIDHLNGKLFFERINQKKRDTPLKDEVLI